MVLNWQADFRTSSADRVERAYADDYELVVLEFRLLAVTGSSSRVFTPAAGSRIRLPQARA